MKLLLTPCVTAPDDDFCPLCGSAWSLSSWLDLTQCSDCQGVWRRLPNGTTEPVVVTKVKVKRPPRMRVVIGDADGWIKELWY